MLRLFKKVRDFFDFEKLKFKFIIFFLIVSLIPTLIIGVSSYLISKSLIIEKDANTISVNISELNKEINSVLDERETIAMRFSIDSAIQNQFTYLKENNEYQFQITRLLQSGDHTKGNNSIILKDKADNIYSNLKENQSITKAIIDKYSYYLDNLSLDHKWFGVELIKGEYVLPFAREIYNLDTGEKIGIVIVNLRESTVNNIYKNLINELNEEIYILDENGIIISCGNKEKLGSTFDSILERKISENSSKGYYQSVIDGKNVIIVERIDYKTNWKYVGVIPLDVILEGTKRINRLTMYICILSATLSLIFGVTIASKITIPINDFIDFIKKVDGGHLELEYSIDRKDELGKLVYYFNKMINKLKISIEEMILAQKAKKDAEIKALVFQINPHFLYNTLSSIVWLAYYKENEKVIKMADSLSKLFRISISKGKEIIKIGKELEHIQSYTDIQNIRYQDEFSCIFDIDEEIIDYYTPKLILQPLVENAIYHGIKNLDCKGIIIIEVKRVEDTIVFRVMDNGNAITIDKINKLNYHLKSPLDNRLKSSEENSELGIGTKNVQDRINLFFGDEYGLYYEKNDKYTVATITIPILEEEQISIIEDSGGQYV